MADSPNPRPFILTEAQRKQVATRLMVQPPEGPQHISEVQRYYKDIQRISGFPPDVLMVLQVLEDLADQGNGVAKELLVDEQERLGITYPRWFRSGG